MVSKLKEKAEIFIEFSEKSDDQRTAGFYIYSHLPYDRISTTRVYTQTVHGPSKL